VKPWSERRVTLVAGKGGVGRSTAAWALAERFAAAGHATLLLEAVVGAPGPSAFADRLGRAPSPEPVAVGPRLAHARLEPRYGQERFLREIVPLGPLVHAALHSRALARMLDAGPSMDELGVLHHFLVLAEELAGGQPRFARVVVDLPATGHAIALAELPNSILRIAPRGPIADRLRRGQALLHDASTSGALIVTIPEPLALQEALDLAAGLRKAQVPIGAFLLNRAPADEPPAGSVEALRATFADEAVLGRRTLEARALAGARAVDLAQRVAPVPVLRAHEVLGGSRAAADALGRAFERGMAVPS
jgi:anion-transporting  ArsA/GET3 family ATPase